MFASKFVAISLHWNHSSLFWKSVNYTKKFNNIARCFQEECLTKIDQTLLNAIIFLAYSTLFNNKLACLTFISSQVKLSLSMFGLFRPSVNYG
jgi:hypothetical protein